ncbi:Arginine permease RocE [Vibrio parahaemolyticus]|nr:Arginine permease RocE [Vibrio parahaemolyticus]
MVFGVWCLVFGVWCLVFGVWCFFFIGFRIEPNETLDC